MKHRILFAAALVAVALATVAAAAVAAPKNRLFQYSGEVLGTSATAIQVQVAGGNPIALRTLIGQSQNQTFSLGANTEILVWQRGVPHVAPWTDLAVGDAVLISVRAPGNSSLTGVETTPAAIVGDHGKPANGPGQPLFLYVGTVAGPQTGGHVALHVTDGNRLALLSLLGQPVDQTFTYGYGTIFLLWQGKVPTVISPSQLKAGDRITVRIRAPRVSTLAQIEATPAAHVGDHEPADPSLSS